MIKNSERAVFVVRKMSLTPLVPTLLVKTGFPSFKNSKLDAESPSDRCHCTWGVGSLKVEMRYPTYWDFELGLRSLAGRASMREAEMAVARRVKTRMMQVCKIDRVWNSG